MPDNKSRRTNPAGCVYAATVFFDVVALAGALIAIATTFWIGTIHST